MSNRNPLLQVKLTLPQKMVQESLPLLLTLIDARVLQYSADLSQQSNRYPLRTRAYEVLVNPPKGTVDNAFWAECVLKTAERNNIPALIVRPQEGTSRPSTQQLTNEQIEEVVKEVRELTPEQVKEELLKLRVRQRMQQIKEGTSLDFHQTHCEQEGL